MLNVCTLMGRVTKDPELRETKDGKKVSSATIACDENMKDKNGEKQTLFLTCNFFGKTAETLVSYVHKGDLIAVSGRLRQRKYTNRDNIEVTTYELMVDRLDLMPKSANAKNDVDDLPLKPLPEIKAEHVESLDSIDDDLPF